MAPYALLMMKKIVPFLGVISVSLLPPAAFASSSSFSEKCPDIPACAKAVGELTGQKYLYDGDVKGKVMATPNVELTKENAELLFTNMLNLEGFSRVPLGEAGSFQIIRQRDARDQAIPWVTSDQKHAPELPNNWDLYTMKYKATNPEVVEHLARMSRSFMPANSRIIPDEIAGILLITDTAMNLKKLYTIISGSDIKPSAAVRKKMDEEERARNEARKEEHRENAKPKPPKT